MTVGCRVSAVVLWFILVNCAAVFIGLCLVAITLPAGKLKLENANIWARSNEEGLHTALLLAVVLSRPNSTDIRNTIRSTWAKRYQGSRNVRVKFSIGISELPDELLKNLTTEQHVFGDLMLLHNVKDSYSNLSLKVLQSFVLASSHSDFSYILKTDDDSFLLLDVIVEELENRTSTQSFYWGYMFNRAPVQTKGRYAEHNWILSDFYLPYAKGIAYVLSRDLVRSIAGSPTKLALYNNEDVSVGAWISPYVMDRRHDNRFVANFEWCVSNGGIVFNPVSTSKMHVMYNNYVKTGLVC